MRKFVLAALAVAVLGWAGAASAQSHQGGYLGLNPGGNQTASTATPRPPDIGSRQGGYLGLNHGANLQPAKTPETGDMRGSPQAWCAKSPEPSRCRGSAESNHRMCLEASNYEACRFAFDRMYFK